jgi:hypothetical protein
MNERNYEKEKENTDATKKACRYVEGVPRRSDQRWLKGCSAKGGGAGVTN